MSILKRSLTYLAVSVACSFTLAACGGGTNDSPDTASEAGSSDAKPSSAILAVNAGQTSPALAGPYGQDASQYTLTFSDEFDNGFDSSKWTDHTWDATGNPVQNYAVEGGSLKIWPQRDANGAFFNRVIDTDGNFYQTHGYFEIEAKLPVGKGAWPAFWLYNHDDPGSYRPEIDIMEAYSGGGPASEWSDANYHPTAYAPTTWTGNPGALGGTKMLTGLGDLSAGFHKYAVKWEPDRQTFYFDGKEVYSVDVTMPGRMYVMLDLLFGSASGEPDETTPQGKGNAFEVNYVRVWKLGGTPPAPPSPPPSPPTTPPHNEWVRCAVENGTCTFRGTRLVRYGVGNHHVTRTATGSIACGNWVFGDPAPGLDKVCDYAARRSR